MSFSVFSGYKQYGKNEKNMVKVFWHSILFQPINLSNLQPVTALINTAGGPHQVDKWQHSLLTTNHYPQSMRTSNFRSLQIKAFKFAGASVVFSYILQRQQGANVQVPPHSIFAGLGHQSGIYLEDCNFRVLTPVGISGKSRELSSVIPDREIVGNSIYFVLNSGKCVRQNFSLN